MSFRTYVKWFVFLLSFLLVAAYVAANELPGKHAHDEKNSSTTAGGHDDTNKPMSHQHDKWVSPPAEYANVRSTRWDDAVAIDRGRQIYENYCLSCHGADGLGTGPEAEGLSHPPADLTHHFHTKSGDGDAYLFWRVSEGGTAEPFKSMNSAMPAFESELSEDDRWDVLAYVHDRFHHGFKSESLVAAEGKVIAVAPESEQIVVEHGKIEGFMDAMTMGYKVHPASLLNMGVKAGDRIRFTIDRQQNAIVAIEKLKP